MKSHVWTIRLKMMQMVLLGGVTVQHEIGRQIRLITCYARGAAGQTALRHLRRCLLWLTLMHYSSHFALVMTFAQTHATSNNIISHKATAGTGSDISVLRYYLKTASATNWLWFEFDLQFWRCCLWIAARRQLTVLLAGDRPNLAGMDADKGGFLLLAVSSGGGAAFIQTFLSQGQDRHHN